VWRYGAVVQWLTSRPIAHRGLFDAAHPENTMAAFRRAIERGIPFEFDVQLTRDGHPVVLHDASLERMAGPATTVANASLHEIQRLQVGDTAERVPLLDDVLALVDGAVPIVVDVRRWQAGDAPGLEAVVADRLRAYGHGGALAVQSFDPRSVLRLRRLLDDVAIGQVSGSLHSANALTAAIGRTMLTNAVTHPDFLSYELDALPSAWVGFWHRLGKPIIAWTVRTAEDELRARELADNFFFDDYLPAART
jgi:glycerophosphoryl diester phosphodiesterase